MFFFSYMINQRYDIIICVKWFELISRVSDAAHGLRFYDITQLGHHTLAPAWGVHLYHNRPMDPAPHAYLGPFISVLYISAI